MAALVSGCASSAASRGKLSSLPQRGDGFFSLTIEVGGPGAA